MTTTGPARVLPLSAFPGQDETFHSWITRLTEKLGVEPLNALRAVGYATDHRKNRITLTGYGITLDDPTLAAMSHATRVDSQRIAGTLLNTFDGGPFTSQGIDLTAAGAHRLLGLREWIHLGTSNACLDCLRSNGHQWLLPWRLPWTTICVHHQTFFTTRCGACGAPYNAGHRADNSLGPGYANSSPTTRDCGASTAGAGRRGPNVTTCGHTLTDDATTACSHPLLLTSQRNIDQLLTPDHRNHNRDYWNSLRAVTAVLLTHGDTDLFTTTIPDLPCEVIDALTGHYAERDHLDSARHDRMRAGGDHRGASRKRHHTRTPTDPHLMAAPIAVAQAVLTQLNQKPETTRIDLTLAGDLLEALRERLRLRGRRLTSELRQRGASEVLVAASKTSSGYNNLLATHHQGKQPELDTRHIPHLFPWDDYQPVADLLRATRTTDDYARTFLSLCAAKLVTEGTWKQAAEALGADPDKATRNANAVTTRLTSAGQLGEIHQHVATWVSRQAALPVEHRVDYRALRDWHAERLLDSHAAASRILEPLGLKVTANRRRCLAIQRWHEQALEPLNDWPGWNGCPNQESAREMYRRFRKQQAVRA